MKEFKQNHAQVNVSGLSNRLRLNHSHSQKINVREEKTQLQEYYFKTVNTIIRLKEMWNMDNVAKLPEIPPITE